MSLIENIKNCIGFCEGEEKAGFRLTSFSFNSAYFENIKSVISYTAEQITLALKKGEVIVTGEELYIKKYCAGDVVICGKISKIEKR